MERESLITLAPCCSPPAPTMDVDIRGNLPSGVCVRMNESISARNDAGVDPSLGRGTSSEKSIRDEEGDTPPAVAAAAAWDVRLSIPW